MSFIPEMTNEQFNAFLDVAWGMRNVKQRHGNSNIDPLGCGVSVRSILDHTDYTRFPVFSAVAVGHGGNGWWAWNDTSRENREGDRLILLCTWFPILDHLDKNLVSQYTEILNPEKIPFYNGGHGQRALELWVIRDTKVDWVRLLNVVKRNDRRFDMTPRPADWGDKDYVEEYEEEEELE
ncbi:hypothetical protein [Microcystis sp. M42BS1]|uniref:hypothetical protein n=1 Tax=Microcystis sp. M42BS1 TaxID=2771192 RepID=UPI002583ED05|nr:hypothetical protein [Microcystis sp. M42BS1]MCA2570682.1 hypothetical protein [Microcystis sp. M42BS1]